MLPYYYIIGTVVVGGDKLNKFTHTQKIAITGILVAISIIISTFSIPINIGGNTTMKITFASPFLIIVGVMFGPVYAGIAYFSNDVISHLIKPIGVYMWEYALIVVTKGVLVAILYRVVEKVNMNSLKVFLLATNISGLTVAFLGMTYFVYTSNYKNNYILTCFLVLAISIINLVVYIVLTEKYKMLKDNYLKLNYAIFLPYVIATIITTFLFKKYFGFTKETAYIVLVPRVLEEVIMVTIYSIVGCILLQILKNHIFKLNNSK